MAKNLKEVKLGILGLLCCSLILSPAQARTLAAIKQEGVLHVKSSGDLPPLTYMVNGQLTGFETDLLTLLASDLGVKIEFSTTSIDRMIIDLEENKADISIGGIGITSTRERKVNFTKSYLCIGMAVVSKDPAIKTRLDLKNKTIAVLSGSTIQSYVQKLPFPKQSVIYSTSDEVTYAVLSGKVDATFAYKMMEPALAKLYPKSGVHFGPVQWSIPVGAMLPDEDSSLRLALNRALAKTMQDGRYAALSNKYFGEDLRCASSTN